MTAPKNQQDLDNIIKNSHFFKRVAFDFLPEISYEKLCLLYKLVRDDDRKKYASLVDCLIKIQWSKFAGLEAITIEESISRQFQDEIIPFDPIGQARHSKAIFDFVAHLKSSLDSMAVFLNLYFSLGYTGGERDFRKPQFQNAVKDINIIGAKIASLGKWLDKDEVSSESIIATRDEWTHRNFPEITAMSPPIKIGYLPIPKNLKNFNIDNEHLSSIYFWTTKGFVDFHFEKMSDLFDVVVDSCLKVEKANNLNKKNRKSVNSPKVSLFPMKATKNQEVKKMRVKKYNPIYIFNASKLLEELPDKLLRFLTKNEADLFAKIAGHKIFNLRDQSQIFLVQNNIILDDKNVIDFKNFEQLGLLNYAQVVLKKGDVLVCGYRGFKILWDDDGDRSIETYSITKIGNELAKLVSVNYEADYIDDIIKFLNKQKINVQLLAISNIAKTGYRYDTLGHFPYEK